MKGLLVNIFLLCILVFWTPFAMAQNDEGFIYGKVTTKTDNHYVGQIRWADEEAFWHDIFNGIKSTSNDKIEIKIEIEDNTEPTPEEIHKWKLMEIWDDHYSGMVHQFTCRYGDIKSITPIGSSYVNITFKNDFRVKVQGGTNDVGTDIHIMDYEMGLIKISWDNIKQIDFFDSPAFIKNKFGVPLYGTVRTNSGSWTGLVQWDNDERLDVDILHGNYEGNRIQVPFAKIKCIRRIDCKSEITKLNDQKAILDGSNDVDCRNQGINVCINDVGRISIPWEEFIQVCFDHTNRYSGQPYRSYESPKRLTGRVKTLDSKTWRGQIVFDKDETWDLEHLEGMMENIKYIIPFRYISVISPRNRTYTNVTLKNGRQLTLGILQDVSEKNEGIVVINERLDHPVTIEWANVDEIILD